MATKCCCCCECGPGCCAKDDEARQAGAGQCCADCDCTRGDQPQGCC